jgi:hypothetical protein
MRKWLPLIVAALTVAVSVPTLAGAASSRKASTRKCSLDLTFVTAPVKVIGNPPLNGTQTRAALVDGTLCSKQFHGAGRLVITYTAPGKGTLPFTIFGPQGSLKGTAHVSGQPQPDGRTSLSGGGTISAGTGLYKGATGSFSATGTKPANSTVNIVHDTGTIRP